MNYILQLPDILHSTLFYSKNLSTFTNIYSSSSATNERILFTSIIVCDFKRKSEKSHAFRTLFKTPRKFNLHTVLWEEKEEEEEDTGADDEATISRYPPLDLT